MNRHLRKDTFGYVRVVTIQISMRIRAVLWESLLGAKFLHADNEDSDQTARMRRLIWVFVGRIYQKVRFITLRLKQWKKIIVKIWRQGGGRGGDW